MALNFLVGGLSGMIATACIQPMDMLKVRLQLAGEAGSSTNPFTVTKNVYRTEGGMKAFYKGIDSAILRQVMYAPIRIGLYFTLSDMIKKRNNGDVPTTLKIAASFTAGAVGSAFANPTDLALVRLQADQTLPEAQRRNYKHVFDALYRIPKEEGMAALYKGTIPTVCRACAINVAMMVSYDEAKEYFIKKNGPGKLQIFKATMVSAVFTSTFSLPFDNIKTKIQKMKPNAEGVMPYSGVLDCMKKTAAREGVTGLWTGLPTYYFRVGPHAMITLIAAEMLKRAFGMPVQ